MNALVLLVSIHHKNTEKIARVIAGVLDAPIKEPQQVDREELQAYDLIGFGSGIYDGHHHQALLNLAEKLPQVTNKKAFLFSTSSNLEPAAKIHAVLRGKLISKGFSIEGEYSCAGYNTNSFLKFIGGMNKGRPNSEDLRKAELFALNLKRI